MKNNFFLLIVTAITSLMLGSCEKNDSTHNDFPLPLGASTCQVDMTIVVPIHSSSLEYFDYVIHYQDTLGKDVHDTIHQGDITNNLYNKTFSYANTPVSCTAKVELLPKFDDATFAIFYFYNPKPYIYPNVRNLTSPTINETPDNLGEITSTLIEMFIGEFKSTYGTVFSSFASVNRTESGYEIFTI